MDCLVYIILCQVEQPREPATTPRPLIIPSAINKYTCGIKGTNRRRGRVVGGADGAPGEWCWQVQLGLDPALFYLGLIWSLNDTAETTSPEPFSWISLYVNLVIDYCEYIGCAKCDKNDIFLEGIKSLRKCCSNMFFNANVFLFCFFFGGGG